MLDEPVVHEWMHGIEKEARSDTALDGRILPHAMSQVSPRASSMRIDPEISGVHVTILGKFNPAIFTPAWFALHDLLPKSAAESANLRVAHQEITAFSTDWLRLEVRTGRFLAETEQAPIYPPARPSRQGL